MTLIVQFWHLVRWLRPRPWPALRRRRRTISNPERVFEQLRRNPAVSEMRRHRNRELARERALIADDERGLVQEIRAAGYPILSIQDLVVQGGPDLAGIFRRRFHRRFAGPYPRAYPILARHLSVPHHVLLRARIADALGERDIGVEIERKLLAALDAESDPDVRARLAKSLLFVLGSERAAAFPQIVQVMKARVDEFVA